MSDPAVPLTSVIDPHWWRREAAGPDVEAAGVSAPAVEPEGGSALAFWALMGFTFVLLIAPQNIVPALRPLRIGLIAAGTGLAALLADRLGRGQPITIVTREIKLAICLLAWAIVTIPLSSWPGGSVALLLDLYLKTVVIFVLIANVVNTTSRLRWIAWGMTLMTIPIALTALKHFAAGTYVGGGVGQAVKRIVGYEAGLTQNPNDLALVLNLILPLTLALFAIAQSPARRVCLLAVIGLQAVGVVVTFSRAGFLTLVTTFAVHFVVSSGRRPERRWAFVLLIVAVACAPLLPTDYVNHLFTITDIDTDPTRSAQERYALQTAAIGYVMSHPIVGAGLGQNILALNELLGPVWRTVHNAYLQYAMDLGLTGLLLFVWLVVESIRSAGRAARLAGQSAPDLRVLANGVRTSLLAFAVAAFFSPVGYHFHFYYLAGLAVAARAIAAGASPAPPDQDGSTT